MNARTSMCLLPNSQGIHASRITTTLAAVLTLCGRGSVTSGAVACQPGFGANPNHSESAPPEPRVNAGLLLVLLPHSHSRSACQGLSFSFIAPRACTHSPILSHIQELANGTVFALRLNSAVLASARFPSSKMSLLSLDAANGCSRIDLSHCNPIYLARARPLIARPLITVTNVPFFSLGPFFGICLS